MSTQRKHVFSSVFLLLFVELHTVAHKKKSCMYIIYTPPSSHKHNKNIQIEIENVWFYCLYTLVYGCCGIACARDVVMSALPFASYFELHSLRTCTWQLLLFGHILENMSIIILVYSLYSAVVEVWWHCRMCSMLDFCGCFGPRTEHTKCSDRYGY